jgi:hypothetical protein
LAGKQLRSENYLSFSLHLQVGRSKDIYFSETKTLSIGIRYGFEALRALVGGWMGVRIC